MTEQEQYDVINTPEWFNAMRSKAQEILGAMNTTSFSVRDGWLVSEVLEIETAFQPQGKDVKLHAGVKDNGDPLFEWVFPGGWIAPVGTGA